MRSDTRGQETPPGCSAAAWCRRIRGRATAQSPPPARSEFAASLDSEPPFQSPSAAANTTGKTSPRSIADDIPAESGALLSLIQDVPWLRRLLCRETPARGDEPDKATA